MLRRQPPGALAAQVRIYARGARNHPRPCHELTERFFGSFRLDLISRLLISVSGRSPNAVGGATCARGRGLKVVSFTSSAADNPLRGLSDVAFWIDSRAYNVVECMHMVWLMTVVGMLVEDFSRLFNDLDYAVYDALGFPFGPPRWTLGSVPWQFIAIPKGHREMSGVTTTSIPAMLNAYGLGQRVSGIV